MNDPAYSLSGRLGGTAWWKSAFSVPAILALALIYGWADARLFPVGFLPWVPFVACLYGLVFWLCRLARCRNLRLAIASGFGLGSFAMYAAWVSFEVFFLAPTARIDPDILPRYFSLLLDPWAVWRNLLSIHAVSKQSPGWLWFCWAFEFLVTINVLASSAVSAITDSVFCEHCRAWADSPIFIHLRIPDEDDADVAAQQIMPAKQGDVATVLTFAPIKTGSHLPHLDLEVRRCRRCGVFAAWRLHLVKRLDSSRATGTEKSVLSPFYVLSPEELARVQAAYLLPE